MSTYGVYYEYECSKGHGNGAAVPLVKCSVMVHGKPCTGTLKRVGKGSKVKASA